MKKVSIKRGVALLVLSVFVLSVFLSGYFYHEKKTYEHRNRQLIIQNDSIMSVNIELTRALQGKQSNFQKVTLLNNQTRKEK